MSRDLIPCKSAGIRKPTARFWDRWLASVGLLIGSSDLAVSMLSGSRIGRKLAGGKWELWWIDMPVGANIWHQVQEWSVVTGTRPSPLARGNPQCEEDGVYLGILWSCTKCGRLHTIPMYEQARRPNRCRVCIKEEDKWEEN